MNMNLGVRKTMILVKLWCRRRCIPKTIHTPVDVLYTVQLIVRSLCGGM